VTTTDLQLRVDLFAALMVRLDDPFGDRRRILADAGLDAGGYSSLVASWRARFEGDASGALAAQFAEAYAERRARRIEIRNEAVLAMAPAQELAVPARPQPPRDPEPLVDPEPPLPALEPLPAVAVLPSAPRFHRPPVELARTADISAFVPRAAVPFAPATSDPAPPERPAAPPRPRIDSGTADISAVIPRHLLLPFEGSPAPPAPLPVAVRPPQHLAGTADISAFVPRPATPFSPAPTPSPPASAGPAEAAPRRRLIRFDPQTGQPLPVPTWVDLPPEPGGKK